MQWLLEFLWPPARMQRIERELNAAERYGIAKMLRDHHNFVVDNALREYRKPMLCTKFLEPASLKTFI